MKRRYISEAGFVKKNKIDKSGFLNLNAKNDSLTANKFQNVGAED